ncbi:MAG: ATP-binding protein, partial [Terrimicrobiaceae bacterium]|nr:ATP-binding protein [Terrimicrobiaceae bacterium]
TSIMRMVERALENIPRIVDIHSRHAQLSLRTLASSPLVQEQVETGNTGALAARWRSLAGDNSRDLPLGRVLFFDAGGRVIFDTENPPPSPPGDVPMVREGFSLDPSGELLLTERAEVWRNGRLVGHIEWRKRFSDLFSRLVAPSRLLNYALTVPKGAVDRAAWEERSRRLGRSARWDDMSGSVLAESSWPSLPEAARRAAAHHSEAGSTHLAAQTMEFDGQSLALAVREIHDAQGRLLGCLLLAADISSLKEQFHRSVWVGGVAVLSLLVIAGASLVVLLRRTDAGILEQKRALEEKQRTLALVNEFAISAIAAHRLLFDGDGRAVDYEFLEVNPAFERHTGLKAAEVVGRRVTDVVPGIRETGLIEKYGEVVRTGKPQSFDLHVPALGRDFSVNAFRIGEGLFATIFYDITAKKAAERELRELNLQLEKALVAAQAASAEKTAFVSRINHELMTPMNGVIGFTELLAGSPLNSEQREYVGFLRESGSRLMELLNQLLVFADLEHHAIETKISEFDLRELFRSRARELCQLCKGKGLECRCRMSREVPSRWRGDPMMINRVLFNLCQNAVKFTASGRVILRLGSAPGGGIRFELEDTGIGISPVDAPRLFQPFWQADESLSRKFEGAGLGL